ncbi:hypothetical protein D9756_003064 [Leucocoprinus leucothites]|uniref:Nephrocystin 3-like N-terminal domain-containing protein n=1 Tax=Leucocoprinus leucothites TaxID=201217 RepID=A0A8H5G7B6_9AGAR|nr:hypothetical protein D9756_003064 [Leucoagaricus leucothites]
MSPFLSAISSVFRFLTCSERVKPLETAKQSEVSGAFANAHDFILNNPIMVDATDNDFMEKFSGYTIRGAELDSSARDPPPRCHPGTRVKIVDHLRSRFRSPTKRVQWLVGPAGVGKSAIMQTVAELERETSYLLAALFFSAPNGRNDPTKVIFTLAYQISRQNEGYRNHIRSKVKADPHLWERSIEAQFTEFIIEPFATKGINQGTEQILIFIDGLDECKGQREQLLFLSLIHNFTDKHPHAPLLWVIASRPEAHITAYLDPLAFYDKEEVLIDSPEACRDVERFVRAELDKIRSSDPLIKLLPDNWPPENQLLRFLAVMSGLFIYAEVAIRFIGDLSAGDPIARFQIILGLIDDASPSQSDTNPMARLDVLYQYIVSQVSSDNIRHVEEILAFVINCGNRQGNSLVNKSLSFMCNWMGMPPNVMYSALRQLHSVLYVPPPADVAADAPSGKNQCIRAYHKSFSEFILDPERSGISLGTVDDENRRNIVRAHRILQDIPDSRSRTHYPPKNIILSWRYNNRVDVRQSLYFHASQEIRNMTSLPNLPLPKIAHAVKAMEIDLTHFSDPMSTFLLGLLFGNETCELAQLLENDGAIQDIPVRLLGLDSFHSKGGLIGVPEDASDYPDKWLSPTHPEYLVHHEKLTSHFNEAKTHSMDNQVRVFIGTQLKGIARFKTTVSAGMRVIYYFMYDFSAIYDSLRK